MANCLLGAMEASKNVGVNKSESFKFKKNKHKYLREVLLQYSSRCTSSLSATPSGISEKIFLPSILLCCSLHFALTCCTTLVKLKPFRSIHCNLTIQSYPQLSHLFPERTLIVPVMSGKLISWEVLGKELPNKDECAFTDAN